MRLPPLRLHLYGIRLRIVYSFLAIALTFVLSYIFRSYIADFLSVLIFELIIMNFVLGYHEFHTTSASYLSLRSHRKSFFISSILFGLVVSLILGGIINAYYYLYEGASLPQISYVNLIIFPTLIFYLVYLLGNCFAIFVKPPRLVWTFIGLGILGIALFYKQLWGWRYYLQQVFLLLPILLTGPIPFYVLIIASLIPPCLVILFNYLTFSKKTS